MKLVLCPPIIIINNKLVIPKKIFGSFFILLPLLVLYSKKHKFNQCYFKLSDKLLVFCFLTNNKGNAMSLKQQGNHTAMKRNIKIIAYVNQLKDPLMAIMIWKSDAHVLNKTCPKCGNFVDGLKYAIATPNIANGFISHHFSIKPICMPLFGRPSITSPK